LVAVPPPDYVYGHRGLLRKLSDVENGEENKIEIRTLHLTINHQSDAYQSLLGKIKGNTKEL
jgi:hypothetical protein